MTPIEIIAQALSIVALVAAIISVQCRKTYLYFIIQGFTGLLFSISFLMLGAYTGAVLNALNIIRSIFLVKEKKSNGSSKWYLRTIMQVLYISGTLWSILLIIKTGESITKNILLTFLILAAQIISSELMWTHNGKIIRIGMLCTASPMWLVYNIFSGSVGAILCEIFNLMSISIALIRFCRRGYED